MIPTIAFKGGLTEETCANPAAPLTPIEPIRPISGYRIFPPRSAGRAGIGIWSRNGILLVLWCLMTDMAACGQTVTAWGYNWAGQTDVPGGMAGVTAIAAGQAHALALKQDGTVVSWGSNDVGERMVPSGLSGVVAIDAGGTRSMALKSDGTVVCWGSASTPSGLNNVVAIAAGSDHSLALRNDGTVFKWGYDVHGPFYVPEGLDGVVAIAAGNEFSLALKSDGTVVAWGFNPGGRIDVPQGLSDVIAISCGDNYSMALKKDGTVVTWPGNSPPLSGGVAAIAAGGFHSLAMTSDGTIAASGSNNFGETTIPAGLTGVSSISAGAGYSLALSGSASLAPAVTSSGLIVTEAAGVRPTTPVFQYRIAATGNPASYAAAGLPPGLSLNTATGVISGVATARGDFPVTLSATNAAGTGSRIITFTVLGTGPEAGVLPASLPPAATTVPWIRTGNSFSATGLPPGMTIDPVTGEISGIPKPGHYQSQITVSNAFGTLTVPWNLQVTSVVSWGWGVRYGYANPQTLCAKPGRVLAVASGEDHALALMDDGTLTFSGEIDFAETETPWWLNGVKAIAAGIDFSLALRNDGTVVAWGHNQYDQRSVPGNLNGVVAIAAGTWHALALKNNGSVVAWGNNYNGQTRVPADLNNVTAIAAGPSHSLALRNDGTVVVWGGGRDYAGFTTTHSALGDVVSIAPASTYWNAGSWLALKSDGAVIARNYHESVTVPPPADLTQIVVCAGIHLCAGIEERWHGSGLR